MCGGHSCALATGWPQNGSRRSRTGPFFVAPPVGPENPPRFAEMIEISPSNALDLRIEKYSGAGLICLLDGTRQCAHRSSDLHQTRQKRVECRLLGSVWRFDDPLMNHLRRDHRRGSGLVEAVSGWLSCVWATHRCCVEKDTNVIAFSEGMKRSGQNLMLEPEPREDQDRAVFCGERVDEASMRPWRTVFLKSELAMA